MDEKPTKIDGTAPPGYDYEEAMRRAKLRDEAGSWRDTEYYAGKTQAFFAETRSGEWTEVVFKTFRDGVIWQEGYRPIPDETVLRFVPRDVYYSKYVGTPVFRGDPVTRYIAGDKIKTRGGITTNPQKVREWIADSRCFDAERPEDVPPLSEIDSEELDIKKNVRLLHATRDWAYWSDHKMTPSPRKQEIGYQGPDTNGEFSEAAETLLTWFWRGRGNGDLSDGKRRLNGVEQFESVITQSLHRRYGMANYVNHNHSLKKIVAWTGEELDTFYVVETIYAGMNPDGFVDRNYAFYDRKTEAEEAFLTGYPARRARRSKYLSDRKEWRERHSPLYKYVGEDGTVVDRPENPFDDLFRRAPEGGQKIRVNRPLVPSRHSAEGVLLYGLGHYVVTGKNFGEGVTYRLNGNIHVTIGIKTDRPSRLTREEKGWSRLLQRFVHFDADVEVKELRNDTDHLWREVIVPVENAHDLGKKLAENPGPKGHGWTKERLDESIDHNSFY